jgi:hypothetical protein
MSIFASVVLPLSGVGEVMNPIGRSANSDRSMNRQRQNYRVALIHERAFDIDEPFVEQEIERFGYSNVIANFSLRQALAQLLINDERNAT